MKWLAASASEVPSTCGVQVIVDHPAAKRSFARVERMVALDSSGAGSDENVHTRAIHGRCFSTPILAAAMMPLGMSGEALAAENAGSIAAVVVSATDSKPFEARSLGHDKETFVCCQASSHK